MGIKFNRERNLIISIILCWVVIISLYLWNSNISYDPFYLGRLTYLNMPNSTFNLDVFIDLPFTYFYNYVSIEILGIEPIENGYIPLIQFLSLFSLLILGKVLYQKFENPYKSLFFIVPIVIFINVFLFVSPYQEYYIGYSLYPLFLWALYKYSNKPTYQIAIILILIFITIHFFAIPMSMWIVQLLITYFLIIQLSNFFIKGEDKSFINLNLVILISIIWIFWNYKFLNYISGWGVYDLNGFINLLKDLIYAQNSEGSLSNFTYIPTSDNPLTRIARIIYLSLITIPIGLKFIYEILFKKDLFFFMRSKDEILILGLIIPFIFEFIIYGLEGTLSFRYLYLIFPFVSYYYILNSFSGKLNLGKLNFINFLKIHNKKIINLYLIILIISSSFLIESQIDQNSHALSQGDYNSLANWYSKYIPNESSLVTDHKTEKYLKYYLMPENSEYVINRVVFTPELYEYLSNSNNDPEIKFKYLLIDYKDLDEPLAQGPPRWVQLVPLTNYINRIDQNDKLSLIFDSKSLRLYQNF